MKKLMIALAVGVLTLSMAGIGAATDVNIYGASAQYNFWSAEAANYLNSNAGGHCSGTAVTGSYTPTDGTATSPGTGLYYHGAKYFIATATGCQLVGGGPITIRVGAYDSADGAQAVIGTTNVIDYLGCKGNERTQLNATGSNVLHCEPTTLGASDVDGSSIVEQTIGQLDGPKGPVSPTLVTGSDNQTYDLGQWTAPDNAYGSFGYTPVDTTSANSLVNDYHPLVVPFGFFANNSLATANATYPNGLQNLTTAQAEQLFSGNVSNWSQFGLPAGNVVLCMRVGGSGTYATFDNGVMNTNGVGPGLPAYDTSTLNGGTASTTPAIWFNNTSGDMMDCINRKQGAIGFADADSSNITAGGGYLGTYGPLSFNGVVPSATAINNGAYDRFWSLEHIFELKTLATTDANAHKVAASLAAFAAVPANIPTVRQPYWTTSTAVKWHKASDVAYPPVSGPYSLDTEY